MKTIGPEPWMPKLCDVKGETCVQIASWIYDGDCPHCGQVRGATCYPCMSNEARPILCQPCLKNGHECVLRLYRPTAIVTALGQA